MDCLKNPSVTDTFCPRFCPKINLNSTFKWTIIKTSEDRSEALFIFRKIYLLGKSFSRLVKVRSTTFAIFWSSPSTIWP